MHKLKVIRFAGSFLFFMLFNALLGHAQLVTIVFRNGFSVNERLKAYSDHQLITYQASYELSTIYSVQFTSKDIEKGEFYLAKLSKSDIIVFIGSNRLNPINAPEQSTGQDSVTTASSKDVHEFTNPHEQFSVGIGGGLDYGGIGFRLSYIPINALDIFFAGGYAITGFGVNGGAVLNLMPNRRFTPTLSLMYGYNAGVAISGAPQYDKFYYGPSMAAGFKLHARKKPMNALHISLIIPFRSSDYDKDIAALKSSGIIKSGAGAVLLSIGYLFGFRNDRQ